MKTPAKSPEEVEKEVNRWERSVDRHYVGAEATAISSSGARDIWEREYHVLYIEFQKLVKGLREFTQGGKS